jgi:hypothetical protein
MNTTTNLQELKEGKPYTWGEVIKIHEFFSYAIVQSHPHVFEGNAGTSKINTRKYEYHPYVDGRCCSESFSTVDSAIAACIAYRHEGANHHADRYFIKAIK